MTLGVSQLMRDVAAVAALYKQAALFRSEVMQLGESVSDIAACCQTVQAHQEQGLYVTHPTADKPGW